MSLFEANSTEMQKPTERVKGCGTIALLVITGVWAIGLSLLDLFLCWSVEQSLVENYVGMYDFRWIIHSIYCVLLLVPMILLYTFVKIPRLKIMFRLWLVAGCFAAVGIPMKLLTLTEQQETALLQIGICVIFLFGQKFFQKNHQQNVEQDIPSTKNLGIVAIICACLTIPWILFGALGSWEDTLLFCLSGFLFGLTVSSLIYPLFLDITEHQEREIKFADFMLDGFSVALFLLIMITAMAQNGSQPMLLITVPISGFLIAAISISNKGTRDRGKIGAAAIAGFSLALPLVWFDMDELYLLISSTPGEVLEWALKAAWFTFMFSLLLIIVLMINFQSISKVRLTKKINILLGSLMVVALVVVYLTWGRVGFFGERFFVVMKQTADLSNIQQNGDISQKRKAVYDELVKTADTSQAQLRTSLDKLGIRFTPYYLVNGIEVQSGFFTRMWINRRTDVDRIVDSPVLRPLPKTPTLAEGSITSTPDKPAWNLSMIGVDRVWTELGITGKGIVIGDTDSGADGQHVEVASTYRGAIEGNDYNWLDPWNGSAFPQDLQGHGTETLGLIVGKNVGIAPDAEWVGCVNLARNLGNPAHYLDCMQFMLAPYPQEGNSFTDGDPAKGVMIVNNSWGCPSIEGCDPTLLESAAIAMEKAGIFMSVAAGNTGYYGCGSVTDPMSIYSEVYTAGSINQSGEVSAFSSLGPVLVDGSKRIKPDIVAPGEGVVSSFPGGTYESVSGTSFAAPHLTGVVALMWSANPNLIGNVEATRQILDETAAKINATIPQCAETDTRPDNALGYGLLNAFDAVKAAIAYK